LHSDIDVLTDFKPGATQGIGFRFFGYGEELAAYSAADRPGNQAGASVPATRDSVRKAPARIILGNHRHALLF
jgi:hypothetical protein